MNNPRVHSCSQAPDPAYVAAQTGVVVGSEILEGSLDESLKNAKATVATEAMGAVVVFEGVVRDHDGGREVNALEYSAHPEAKAQLELVLGEIIREHPQVRAYAAHRVGDVPIGEIAFAVVVAAAHRGSAFEAASVIADRVKAEVPIWKKQQMKEGDTVWVGLN